MKTKRTKILPTETVKITHEHAANAHLYLFFFAFLKSTALAIAFVVITLGLIFGWLSYRYLHTVSLHAGIGIQSLLNSVEAGWKETVPELNGRENILILGVDTLGNRDSSAINTDTIMIASLKFSTAAITTFSIPRDLYLMDQKIKINGIYDVARKNGDAKPEAKTAEAVAKLTGLQLQHTVVIELAELGKLIDALGGIDVTIDRSFTDTQFPREDVDVTKVHDPGLLYKTVSFQAGKEHMNGLRALEFIRSRHSTDPLEGTDDARALRQQHVISAFMQRLTDKNIPRNPAYVGDLLSLYRQDFAQYISLEELVATGKAILASKHLPTFNSEHFAVKGVEAGPALYHPDYFANGQWVYLLTDQTGKQIQNLVAGWLK